MITFSFPLDLGRFDKKYQMMMSQCRYGETFLNYLRKRLPGQVYFYQAKLEHNDERKNQFLSG